MPKRKRGHLNRASKKDRAKKKSTNREMGNLLQAEMEAQRKHKRQMEERAVEEKAKPKPKKKKALITYGSGIDVRPIIEKGWKVTVDKKKPDQR